MMKKQSFFLKAYFKLYRFVAGERLIKKDIDVREIHTVLVVVLTTGLLMWIYAYVAATMISSPVPGIVGYFASTVHLFSPLLFRVTNKVSVPTNVLLLAGALHQGTFSYYTGGFDSNILIWYGILPMLGGLCSGKRGVITWFLVTVLVALGFVMLRVTGHQFPNLITEQGRLISQALLVFGWVFLSSTIVLVYVNLREQTETLLQDQSKKIEDLFRVLFHDLANPMGRLAIGLAIMKKKSPEMTTTRGFGIAEEASDSMLEIIQNVRKVYAASKGKSSIDLSYVPLKSAIDYVVKIFEEELGKKKVKINYDPEKCERYKVLVEPISFNNQVLSNIISNAIKFSGPEGQIEISIRPLPNHYCELEIRDQGIGMPEPLIGHLFDLNKKTSRPGTNGENGTGFGMHIMKSFVEMYGGQVLVESTEGENSGTSIKLILQSDKI